MARFRIRFLVHEIDLPVGEIVIGRSAGCQLTLDDPLVSRNHARLVIDSARATIEDLGSRNGVRVNGRAIDVPTELVDGDRVRIGTQQLVVRRIDEEAMRNRRATGFMIHCAQCGLPHSTDVKVCPNCGQGESLVIEEPTSTVQSAWNLELLVETMRRAQDLGRPQDLERLLVRARDEMERSPHDLVDRRRIDQLADCAVRFAVDSGDIEWARWALHLYAEHGIVPRPEVGRCLSLLPAVDRSTLAPAVDEMVRSLPPSAVVDIVDEESIQTLRNLIRQAGTN
ncbi:MAG TPA: FHA domain-containing protein [Polyangiaceae bacterium]|nr:FHA domain-containing protein [Polyangiaceae bacterium]